VFDYFLSWSDDPLGRLHLGLAMLAMVTGPFIFLMPKGAGWHRAMGYTFIFSMLAVNISALSIYDFSGEFNFFHAAAIASLTTLLPGIGFLIAGVRTKNPHYLGLHGAFMGWVYFGLVSAAIAEVVTRGFPYLLHGEGGWTRFITTLSVFMGVSGIVVFRIMRKRIPLILGLNPK